MKHYIASTHADPFIPDTIIPCDEDHEIITAEEYLRNAGLPAHPVLTGDADEAVETGLILHPTVVTDEQIKALRIEAGASGDYEQVCLCDLALEGDRDARGECAATILAARQANTDGALHRYSDGEYLGPATSAEVEESRDLALYDGGAGVIDVDGESCYVTD